MKKIMLTLISIPSLIYTMQTDIIDITINGTKLNLDYIDETTYQGLLKAFEFQKIYAPITNNKIKKKQEQKDR